MPKRIGQTSGIKWHTSFKGTNQAFVEYDTNNTRFKRIDNGSEGNETTYYIGNVEFITYNSTGVTRTKSYIADAMSTDYNSGSPVEKSW